MSYLSGLLPLLNKASHLECCNRDTLPVTSVHFTFIRETLNHGHTTSYVKHVLCGHSVLVSSSATFAPRTVQFSHTSHSATGHSVKKDQDQTSALQGFMSLLFSYPEKLDYSLLILVKAALFHRCCCCVCQKSTVRNLLWGLNTPKVQSSICRATSAIQRCYKKIFIYTKLFCRLHDDLVLRSA